MQDLLDWLKDKWTELVVIILAVPPAVAVIRSRRTKTLDYEMLTEVSVLGNVSKFNANNIQVAFRDADPDTGKNTYTLYDNPVLQIIEIKNSGFQDVVLQDFSQAIKIFYPRANNVVLAGVWQSKPELLARPSEFDWIQNRDGSGFFEIKPRLMLPRDRFQLTVLCDGNPGTISITSHFEKQTRPMKDARKIRRFRSRLFLVFGILFGLLAQVTVALTDNLWLAAAPLAFALYFIYRYMRE